MLRFEGQEKFIRDVQRWGKSFCASGAQKGGPWCLDHREPEKSSPKAQEAEEGLEVTWRFWTFSQESWKVSYLAEVWVVGARRGAL